MTAMDSEEEVALVWSPQVLVASDNITATQSISFGGFDSSGPRVTFWVENDVRPQLREGTPLVDLLPSHAPDVLVLSRFVGPLGPRLVEWARSVGSAVIYHIDDDLLDVPMSLGPKKYAHYHDPGRLSVLREAMNQADLVYASTVPLADRLAEHGIRAPIVAGDLYCCVDPGTVSTPLPATLPVIGYMGSGGHSADLATILPIIEALLDERPILCFELFGTIRMPEQLTRFGSRVRHHAGFSDYETFLTRMKVLGWWVGLAPLEDNAFNRCKADTKWVEYTMAGTAVVASNLPVYHRACADGSGMLADTTESWAEHIRALLDDNGFREATISRAQHKLATVYTRDRLQHQVRSIIRMVSPGERLT